MNRKCCLSVAYYMKTLSYWETRYILYTFVSISTSRSIYVLFMWSVFPLPFSFSLQLIALFQWNRQTRFFVRKYSLRVLLSFYPIFCQFQPSVDYKSVAYKNKCVIVNMRIIFIYDILPNSFNLKRRILPFLTKWVTWIPLPYQAKTFLVN